MNKWDIRYSTGSKLDTYSALIQNFYSLETSPLPAVHITLNTGAVQGEEASVRAYVRYIGILIFCLDLIYFFSMQFTRWYYA